MSNKSPIFPIAEPQHFTDYGFEPQIDYFQVLEEARKHKRESRSRSIGLQFRLQKPISKDDSSRKIKKNKKRWWKNALLFFKFDKWAPSAGGLRNAAVEVGGQQHRIGPKPAPVYMTESRTGSTTPYWTASRAGSGSTTPYIRLRELNMEQHHRISPSSTPIYLVT